MKKTVLIIILVIIAFFAYNYMTTGRFTLVPSGAVSIEEKELKSLESELHDAAQQISQAERSAGASGMDTTSDVEAALQVIKQVERRLEDLKKRTESETMKDKIRQLEDEILLLKKRLGERTE